MNAIMFKKIRPSEDGMSALLQAGQFIGYYGSRMFVPDGHFASDALLRGATPEGHVFNMFKKYVSVGDVVVDVGANIGFHTFSLASLVGPTGKVFAVEADIMNAACLRRSVQESGLENVVVIPAAASDTTGLIPLMSTDMTNNIFSHQTSGEQVSVAVGVRLDDLGLPQGVKLVKMDIEGAELLALRGMDALVRADLPTIVTEFSPYYITRTLGADVSIEYLKSLFEFGYYCIYIHPNSEQIELADVDAVLECQRRALAELNWGHVDLLFSVRPRS